MASGPDQFDEFPKLTYLGNGNICLSQLGVSLYAAALIAIAEFIQHVWYIYLIHHGSQDYRAQSPCG